MDSIGRNILVTGASTGIGRAVAVAFGQQNAHVYLTARDQSALEITAGLVTQEGGKPVILQADLRNYGDIKLLADQIPEVDVIANVAAVWHTDDKVLAGIDYQNFSEEEITATMNVGIIAPMLLVRYLLPKMKSGSKIINLSGTFENGAKGWVPYYVSKKALEEFTVGLSQELEGKDIQVNCISPSDTLTEAYKKFFPQYATEDQCVTPEEVAQAILKLCELESKVSGKIVTVKNED